ncbi:RidA family protein [Pseudovibrio sp. POLY-S9]|uniref:RidA family protein n=1 Tax=Pseudovibrio sp. POLY-S9 TaxID=1576596 RepID=UPI00070AABD6|nr:RidA family protein [Pseudovibrio sp. POLY-S9]
MSDTIQQNLAKLGVTLPEAAAPAANYVPFVKTGKIGADLSIEDGVEAARLCAINLLAQAKAATGDLSKIVRLVKIVGFVNSNGDFGDQPKVINGASDFMVAAMGDAGRHARSAVSAGSLPFNAAVEIEAIFEVAD